MNRETRKSPRPPCPDCEGGRADAPLCDRCAEAYQKAEREAERRYQMAAAEREFGCHD